MNQSQIGNQPTGRLDAARSNDRRTFLAGVAALAGTAGVAAADSRGQAAAEGRAADGTPREAPAAGTPGKHSFRLSTLVPQVTTATGTRTAVTVREFAALRGMSLAKLSIAPGCFREPHWHANADELGYCTAGEVLVTVFSTGNRHDVFRIAAGEMYTVPSGSFHSIENIGAGRAELVAAFSHQSPEDFGLSGAVGCMSPSVMGNAWGLEASALVGVTRSTEDVIFGKTDGPAEVPASAAKPNPLKFAIESIPPAIVNEFGSARVARSDVWPALRTQSMYSLRLGGNGMREPHWHPETAEMGYVRAGRSRMTIKSPSGIDTFEIGPGDMYFIPHGYPHHIENLGSDELHFLVFFDRAMPNDVGYTGGIPAFPRRIVAPALGMTVATLPRYPERTADAMIVQKRNPVAP